MTAASYALNGRPQVSEATRERVEQAARRLDYHPSHAARGLRAVRSDTVGLILPLRPARFGAGPFLEALGGIAQVVAREGFDVLVAHSSRGSDELALCRRLMLSRKVDGLILTGSRVHDDRFAELSARGFPFVVYGRAAQPHIYAAEINNAAGARLAAEHLLALGHERIAFIGGPAELTASVDRLAGFSQALERAARGLGLEPGRDLALVGFGEAAAATYTDPPMTTVDHRPYDVGLVLGRMLLDQLQGKASEQRYQTLEPRLIVLASSSATLGRRVDTWPSP